MMSKAEIEYLRDDSISFMKRMPDNVEYQREARRTMQAQISIMNMILKGGSQ
jgi:hypothetical protein